MEGKSVKKVEGGKLVKVTIRFTDSNEKVRITGDFFLHPEDALEEIEQSIVGVPADAEIPELVKKMEVAVKAHKVQMVGVSPTSFAEAIKEAIQNV